MTIRLKYNFKNTQKYILKILKFEHQTKNKKKELSCKTGNKFEDV